MTHDDIKDLLSDYFDGTLGIAQTGAVTTHLQACGDCRDTLDLLRRAEAAVRAARRRPTVSETEAAVRAVLRRVEPAPELAWVGRLLSSPRWAIPAFAAAFAVLIGTLRVTSTSYSPSEALLYSQDGGRTYALLTEEPSAAAVRLLDMEGK